MALEERTIGTDSRQYATITLWEAALGNGAGGAGDDCVGICYNDSDFDELTAQIDYASANSIKLTVAEADRHDGTAGTGARMCASANSRYLKVYLVDNVTIEWLEWDGNGYIQSGNSLDIYGGDDNKILNVILHDVAGNTGKIAINIFGTVHNTLLANNILYDIVSNNSATICTGIEMDGNSGIVQYCYNNTVYNVTQPTGVGTATGIEVFENEATTHIKNNIVTDTDSTSGTTKDFDFPGTTVDDATNLSSDDTADDGGGSGNLINKASGDQFVSTAGGSEDLHLKSGADAIDAGTDLGTTPSGVEIDIDGRDRDAEGDVWDIGAHELVEVAVGVVPQIQWLRMNTL